MAKIITSRPMGKFESRSKPGNYYSVLAVFDSNGNAYFSCNCPRWTTSSKNRSLEAWERTCSHCEKVGQVYADAVKDAVRRFAVYGEVNKQQVVWWQNGSNALKINISAQGAKALKAELKQIEPKPAKKDRLDYLEL